MGLCKSSIRIRMMYLSISCFIFLIIMTYIYPAQAKVDTCYSCNSDSQGSLNVECEKDPTSQPTGACSQEFGNDYCYVLVTKQKQQGGMKEGWMWNRGCCTPKAGSQICPLDGHSHENNEVYEMWRARCDADNCNIMDPRTSSGGGGDSDDSLTVHGNSGAGGLWTNLATVAVSIVLICVSQ